MNPAEGQKALVASSVLPKEVRGITRPQMEAMGFVFGADVDELFVQCKLPVGWSNRAASQSMYSELVDDKGRVRAGIFYKAAFYDRRAYMTFNCRFTIRPYLDGSDKDHIKCAVHDSGTEIFVAGQFSRSDYSQCDPLIEKAKNWLTKKFPNYMDPTAYWE